MIIKKIAGLLIILLLSACSETESPASVERKNKMKDNSQTRAMLAAFKQQKHRLEFNGCEMLYNGTPFRLGMTVKELEGIFGPYDFFSSGRYVWKEVGIVFVSSKITKEDINTVMVFAYIYIYISDPPEFSKDDMSFEFLRYPKKDYFLLEGMPVDRNIQFRDFIKNSYFELRDFNISDYSYSREVNCDSPAKKLEYYLTVKGGWNYVGSGHIRLKSDPNADNINTIKSVSIGDATDN